MNTLGLKLKIHCREHLDSESWISLLNQLSCSSAVPAMLGEEQSPKPERWALRAWDAALRAGTPIPPGTGELCVNGTTSGWVFKESEMFCLSFQVDLTTTSAAAAPGTGAAAKFLIYSSQNTYKRDFYCYTAVQRGKMQLWEGKRLMESRQCHHNIPHAPLCSLEVPTSYSAPLITANLPTLILFLCSDRRHKKTQHHQKFSVCFPLQIRIWNSFH